MKFLVGFLVTIGLVVLIVVLLLRGGGTATPGPAALNLDGYNTAATTASLIIDAPIIAESNHKEIAIDVTQNVVTFTEYQGYEQSVINTQTFPNNSSSYAVFLHALQHAGFTTGATSSALHDERGYCPAGTRYIYSFNDGSKDLSRLWSTTCGNQGTFKGLGSTVRNLFEAQVPNYSALSDDLYRGAY